MRLEPRTPGLRVKHFTTEPRGTPGEKLDQDNVVERDRYGVGSVMVWEGIHHDRKTDLVIVPGNLTAQRYCVGIIEPVVVPYLQQHHVGIFQHYNARPHTMRHTQNILRIHNVNVLQWPARSLDLSPIEHLWDHLGRQVRDRHDVNNIRDLERALQAEWVRILLLVIRKLICSMRRRLAVLAANDGHTRYWAVSIFLRLTPSFISRTPETKRRKIME